MTTRKRHERTRSRKLALQILYTGAITGDSPTAIAESGRYLDDGGDLPDYALTLIRGCEAHSEDLTSRLDATADNWSVTRMPIVDQSILRIGAFEMLYVDDVPMSVAINEAVELAKAYGAEDESPRFVNGVLGKIATLLEGGAEVTGDEPLVVPSEYTDTPVATEKAAEVVEAMEAVEAVAMTEAAGEAVEAGEATEIAQVAGADEVTDGSLATDESCVAESL